MTTFRPLLAATADNDLGGIKYPVLASYKIDGFRAIVKDGVLLTRNLKPFPNTYVQAIFSDPALNGFDGELICGAPNDEDVFNKTSSAVTSVKGLPDVTFYVFDYFSCVNSDYQDRLKLLESQIRTIDYPNVALLDQIWCSDEQELRTIEEQALANGFEGLMIRSPDGVYKYGRSTLKEGILLKLKRFTDAEAEIIGFVELTENQNVSRCNALGLLEKSNFSENYVGKNTLGAIVVRGINGEFKDVQFNIGSGFDDKLRQEIWNNRGAWLRRIVTFKYFPKGSLAAPRFPVFKTIREE